MPDLVIQNQRATKIHRFSYRKFEARRARLSFDLLVYVLTLVISLLMIVLYHVLRIYFGYGRFRVGNIGRSGIDGSIDKQAGSYFVWLHWEHSPLRGNGALIYCTKNLGLVSWFLTTPLYVRPTFLTVI